MILLVLMLVLATSPAPLAASEVDASHYRLDVSFVPESRTLSGTAEVDWRNTTGEAQDSLFFRLYPNAAYYGDGATVVSDVSVNDVAVEARSRADPTVLEIDAGRTVEPGGRADISLSFETTIPATSDASYGILGGDAESGWWLADWYPVLAGWEAGAGWYLDPPTRFGDPTFAESATYDLAFTAPDGYEVLGSGTTVAETSAAVNGETTTTISSAPGRDLTLSLLPALREGAIETTEREIAGFLVRVALPRERAIPGLAGAILAIASDTLPLYESWLGEYPDRELDITTAPLAGASGVAWSGIVWLDIEAIVRDRQLSAATLDTLRFVLTHELAHQWLAGIVGSNNNDHGFMTEGLANIVAVRAIREIHGPVEAEKFLRAWVTAGYQRMVESGQDGVADAPVTNETDIGVRAQLVYGKGALGFEAIRQAIGDEAFLAGLRAYAIEFRFAISEPADLRHAFESASGLDLDSLWSFWFLEQGTTLAEIDAVLDGFA